jgi:hypothetical protein
MKLSFKKLYFLGLQSVIYYKHGIKKHKKWALDVCDPTLTVLAPESYFLYPPDLRANFPEPTRNGTKKKQRIESESLLALYLAQLPSAHFSSNRHKLKSEGSCNGKAIPCMS